MYYYALLVSLDTGIILEIASICAAYKITNITTALARLSNEEKWFINSIENNILPNTLISAIKSSKIYNDWYLAYTK